MNHTPIFILSGPTASGKSALALEVAPKLNAVIINCDSKQVYKEIPIITAQPSIEEKAQIEHMLYGTVSAAQNCSVADWLQMAKDAICDVWARGKTPLLVGGSGMYIKMLAEGISQVPEINDEIRTYVRGLCKEKGPSYIHEILKHEDPQIAEKLKEGDVQRVSRAYEVLKQTGKSLLFWQQQKPEAVFPDAEFKTFFLSPPREKVYENCNIRFLKMLENGVMDEIKALDKMSLSPELPAMRAHGVPELLAYLHGNMTLEDAITQSQTNTRHYIKRQFTWFRNQMNSFTLIEPPSAVKAMLNRNIHSKD